MAYGWRRGVAVPVTSAEVVERDFEAIRRLLSDPASQRERAARDLHERGRFDAECAVVAMVLVPAASSTNDVRRRAAVEQCLVAVRRACPPRRALHLVRDGHGVLIVGFDRAGARAARAAGQHAQRLLDAAAKRLTASGAGAQALVGVGGLQPRLHRVAASYTQAGHAVTVARVANEHVPIASWERLGVFRLLVDLPERDVDTFAPQALRHLDDADDGTLRRTLECYLDHAGQAQATANALSLHRATLYYRLDRIKQVTGVDLSDGAQRLELHVWLKLLRLRGRGADTASGNGLVPQVAGPRAP
jgi:sugar diacid utilization regulator